MDFTDDLLPAIDWAQKPIVIVVGNPPATYPYLQLRSYLEKLIIDGKAEVVWLERDSPKQNVFVPQSNSKSASVSQHFVSTLDFEFVEVGNPGVQRLYDDPDLLDLKAKAKLGVAPPLVVIGTTRIVPIEFKKITFVIKNDIFQRAYKRSKVELFNCVAAMPDSDFFGLDIVQKLAGNFEYLASANNLIRFDDPDLYSNVVLTSFLKDNMHQFFMTRSGGPIGNKQIVLDSIFRSNFHAHQRGEAANQDLMFRMKVEYLGRLMPYLPHPDGEKNSFKGNEPYNRIPSRISDVGSLIAHVDNFMNHALSMRGAPERLEAAGFSSNTDLVVSSDPSEVAELLKQEIERGRNELLQLRGDKIRVSAEIRHMRQEWDAFTQSLEAREQRLTINISEMVTESDMIVAQLADFIFDIDLHSDTANQPNQSSREVKYFENQQKDRIAKAVQYIDYYGEHFRKMTASIRTQPDIPINLYNLTTLFIAQRLMGIVNHKDRLLRLSASAADKAMLLAFVTATQEEKNWFYGLESIVPDDTARQLYALVIEAQLADIGSGHKLTFEDLGNEFERRFAENPELLRIAQAQRELIYGRPNGPLELTVGSSAIDAQVVETTSNVSYVERPTI